MKDIGVITKLALIPFHYIPDGKKIRHTKKWFTKISKDTALEVLPKNTSLLQEPEFISVNRNIIVGVREIVLPLHIVKFSKVCYLTEMKIEDF